MNNSTVFCRTSEQGKLWFFLRTGGREYFLFTQSFTGRVFAFYRGGVFLDRALSFDRGRSLRSKPMKKISEKLPAYIRYIEQEYKLSVLKSSRENKLGYKRSKRITPDELEAA